MMPTYKTILYPSDLSPNTRPVFRQAVALAQATGARISMVHVLEQLGSTGRAVIDAYLPNFNAQRLEQEAMHKVLETMRARLDRFCEEELNAVPNEVEAGIVESLEVVIGYRPSEEILRMAKKIEADLIVVGTCTHSAHSHDGIGSTTRRILQHSHIPVLMVPNFISATQKR